MTDEKTSPIDPAGRPDLAAIRARIDAIDAEMHALLIERSSIIDALIEVKRAKHTGVAFRPGREASMMHMFAARHTGSLPLTTVENLWREIISTFTYLQAPYRVHAPVDGNSAETRDTARFYFGFTVPLIDAADAAATVAAVAASRSDLGLVPLGEAAMPWWTALGGTGPQIIARLPFFECDDRPAATPTVVVSNPLDEQSEPDVLCWRTAWPANAAVADALAEAGLTLLASHTGGDTVSALVAADRDRDAGAVAATLAPLGATITPEPVGGYAATLPITETVPSAIQTVPAGE